MKAGQVRMALLPNILLSRPMAEVGILQSLAFGSEIAFVKLHFNSHVTRSKVYEVFT